MKIKANATLELEVIKLDGTSEKFEAGQKEENPEPKKEE